MKKFLRINYGLDYVNDSGDKETSPRYVTIILHEEDGLFVARFAPETVTDLVALGQKQGIDITLEN